MVVKSDPKRLLKELEYYVKYYGSEFKPNQGLEEIINVIQKYSNKGSWLDLGGGSNTPFWRRFFKKLDRIVCVDINHEAFLLSELIINEFKESHCYEKTRELFLDNICINNKVNIEYKRRNILDDIILFDDSFDNITQFGLLGLLKTKEDFLEKSYEILEYLTIEGTYIGVNWIFSNTYQDKICFSNSYICTDLISQLENSKFKLIHFQEVNIKEDENYDKCVIYVLKKIRE